MGGAVRDEILNRKTNDIDFSVVLDHEFVIDNRYDDPFEYLVARLKADGYSVLVETPQHYTVKARFPASHEMKGVADFVLARREFGYTDGRRPDYVEPGTLQDDLARRDFTINAIAKDANGEYIDPYKGRKDIDARIIRTVGNPKEKLLEDALRALRAVRFALTLGFEVEENLRRVIEDADVLEKVKHNISTDRKREELDKMFRFNTFAAGHILWDHYPLLTETIFDGRLHLDVTMKQKGRN